jgi:hypothetical protein
MLGPLLVACLTALGATPEQSLLAEGSKPVCAVIFLAAECPVARLYANRLNELHDRYREQVYFVGVVPDATSSPAVIQGFAKEHGLRFPVTADVQGLAERLSATRTPEVVVLDAQGIQYRGRIDDQYAPGARRPQPTQNYLTDALDALLAGHPVATPRTAPVGCPIAGSASPPRAETNFAEHIAPILFRRCVGCHRPGQNAPFSLTSYRSAARHGAAIAEVIEDGRMPPWGADPRHGRFTNDPSLTAEEKRLIADWVATGMVEGDSARLPSLPEFPSDGWRIRPDTVYSMSEPFAVPAEGTLEYQRFTIDPGLTADRWIRAIQIRPSNAAVVHHATLRTKLRDTSGTASSTGGPSGDIFLAMYVPGQETYVLPPGAAKLLPAERVFVLEVHYTPNGRAQLDRTQIGIVWAEPGTVERELATWVLVKLDLELRPQLPEQQLTGEWPIEQAVVLHALFPHMHLRGQAMRFEAVFPDGCSEILLDVPRYDFNWQHRYVLAEPRRLPQGTTIRLTAKFDNSPTNPRNPDPSAVVRYGDLTTDEMFQGYLEVSPDFAAPASASATAWTLLLTAAAGIVVLGMWRPVVRCCRPSPVCQTPA